MRHLHIVDRIFIALLFGEFNVKVHRLGNAAVDKIETRRVNAHLFDQLIHLDDLSGALGHFHRFAAAQQIDLLDDADIKAFARMTEGQEGGAHAADIAMMVRSPKIDHLVKSAAEFILMVGDIDEKVGGLALAGHQHTVFFVAEGGGAEPERPLGHKGEARLLQLGKHSLLGAGFAQSAFAEPGVVMDAIFIQTGTLPPQHLIQGHPAQENGAFRLRQAGVVVAVSPHNLARQIAEILPVVAILGKRLLEAEFIHVAGAQRVPEQADLPAGIIDIEFTPGVETGGVVAAAQHIADSGGAGADDIERAGGVGADELELDFAAAAGVAAAIAGTAADDFQHQLLQAGAGIEKIDKAGPGDFNLIDVKGILRQMADENLGHFARRHLDFPGQTHGQRRREIAQLFLFGPFQSCQDLRTRPAAGGQGLLQGALDVLLRGHLRPSPRQTSSR